jgi:hypothetical protein
MILVDFNNVTLATILSFLGDRRNRGIEINDDLFRHMMLNVIRNINSKFRADYGSMVIATDSRSYWRKQIFPHYKAARKKARDASDLNWNAIFKSSNAVKEEIRQNFPYKFLEVEQCEADDIIAAIVLKNGFNDKILIVSSDKDYIQLQAHGNVTQYDPTRSRFLNDEDPLRYKLIHIIKGDVGDGIPNIGSPDNCFVVGDRQKKITQKMLDQFMISEIKPDHPWYRNYLRNKSLVDLAAIPEDIQDRIIKAFEVEPVVKDRSKLFNYFAKNKLRTLTEQLNDF